MLWIRVTAKAAEALLRILAREAEGACVRLRQFTTGSCWTRNFQASLGLGVDLREDDDLVGKAGSLTFVMSRELAAFYGRAFTVYLGENRIPAVEQTKKNR